MILKYLSSLRLILILVLAAAGPVLATTVEASVAATATTPPSTANLGPSRPIPMIKSLMAVDPSSSSSPQTPSQTTTEEPTGQDEGAEEASGERPSSIRRVSGWPPSLKIEIDELEVGGLATPSVQTLLRNLKSGFINFGNVDLGSSGSGAGPAEAGSSGVEAGQVVEYA
ncbi:hypothetical protein BG015_008000 [Linnemannia schmuckeri]|uniref:Uncharacterized protein n=1 Tax=Linnemannia schmuckeri TaxID=64567 RepID=A0A9P5RXM7_9FUNG|nr:hypothetical protein BG015_008000 [Linnemannia schmuckeri]